MSGTSRIRVTLDVVARTDVGPTRDLNEDAFLICNLTTGEAKLSPEVRRHEVGANGSLFIVADGVGGLEAGNVASALATQTIMESLRAALAKAPMGDDRHWGDMLTEAVRDANRALREKAVATGRVDKGMGSTATVLLVTPTGQAWIAQVGDSRLYYVADGRIEQLTTDHSLVQEMVDRGLITADKAKRHAIKNVITRALGEADLVQVDLLERQIEDGDLMILCSDGVSNGVDGPRMLEIVRTERDIRDICLKLVAEAGEKYGADNATAIVLRTTVTGRPKPSAGPPGWYRPKTLPLDGGSGPWLGPRMLVETVGGGRHGTAWLLVLVALIVLIILSLTLSVMSVWVSGRGYHVALDGDEVRLYRGSRPFAFIPPLYRPIDLGMELTTESLAPGAVPVLRDGQVICRTQGEAEDLVMALVQDPAVRGDLYYARRDWEKAAEALAQVPKPSAAVTRKLALAREEVWKQDEDFRAAEKLYEDAQWDRAAELYEKVLEKSGQTFAAAASRMVECVPPTDRAKREEYLTLAARLERDMGVVGEATKELRERSGGILRDAQRALEAGRIEDARKLYDSVLATTPGDPLAAAGLACVWNRQEQAAEQLQTELKQSPDDEYRREALKFLADHAPKTAQGATLKAKIEGFLEGLAPTEAPAKSGGSY
ncbi:MAG: hypothetical protein FJX75_21120 [Armatimonadetes bacterium]|nr:hypothetical protein [Armatimonadota bacterium]